jgi:sugar transferase (PEP-CTERM/EpsH1 system associated)
MKIGVVVPRLNGGGTAQCVVDLTNGLVDAGLRPIVICLERMGYVADKICSRDVKIIGPLKRTGNDPAAPFRLATILKEHHCDVVHCHNWGGLVDTVLAAKLARVRAVLHTQHGLDYGFNYAPDHLRSRLRTMIKAVACRGITRVATVSREVAQMVTREWRVPAARVSVVHNGVRVPALDQGHEVRARWRRELGIDESDVLIGTVATFRPVKDLHTMLEAMALVARVTSRARLVLLGDGPLKLELEATVERLGLGSVVRFPGWRIDASQLLPALDLFVLSSLSEGISLALLEAMAAGVPVVATDVGGNREIIEGPNSGILVPPRSPHDLAHAMTSLIDAPTRRCELSVGGRARVAAAFSLKRMVGDYQGLYTSLMTSRPAKGN